MSSIRSGGEGVTTVMAGSLPALQGRPQGTVHTAARSTSGRVDLAPVQSPLTPTMGKWCPPSPEIGRGEQVAPGPFPAGGRGEPELPPFTTQAANLFHSVVAFVSTVLLQNHPEVVVTIRMHTWSLLWLALLTKRAMIVIIMSSTVQLAGREKSTWQSIDILSCSALGRSPGSASRINRRLTMKKRSKNWSRS